MNYLDWKVLDAIDEKAFRATKPFPWVNPASPLTPEGRAALLAELPDFKQFRATFGMARKYGQQPHDRWELRYGKGVVLPAAWRGFIDELQSGRYRAFVARLFGRDDFTIRFEWLYASAGCSVSPHSDGAGKIGSQLFYLNDEDDWDPAWGGATLVLDDEGGMDYRTAPDFGDFAGETEAESVGNRSFIFMRTDHSWHGVRTLRCPEGKMRRLFTAVVDRRPSFGARAASVIKNLVSRV